MEEIRGYVPPGVYDFRSKSLEGNFIEVWRNRADPDRGGDGSVGFSRCRFSPDGRTIAASTIDKRIIFFDVETGKRISCVGTRNAGYAFNDLSWFSSSSSSGDRVVAAACSDRKVYIANSGRSGKGFAMASTESHLISATAITTPHLSTDWFLSGGYDECVRLWDTRRLQSALEMKAHVGMISSIETSTDDEVFLTASYDGFCRIWSVNTFKKLLGVVGEDASPCCHACFSSPGNRNILTVHFDGRARVWNLARETVQATLLHCPLKASMDVLEGRVGSGTGNGGVGTHGGTSSSIMESSEVKREFPQGEQPQHKEDLHAQLPPVPSNANSSNKIDEETSSEAKARNQNFFKNGKSAGVDESNADPLNIVDDDAVEEGAPDVTRSLIEHESKAKYLRRLRESNLQELKSLAAPAVFGCFFRDYVLIPGYDRVLHMWDAMTGEKGRWAQCGDRNKNASTSWQRRRNQSWNARASMGLNNGEEAWNSCPSHGGKDWITSVDSYPSPHAGIIASSGIGQENVVKLWMWCSVEELRRLSEEEMYQME